MEEDWTRWKKSGPLLNEIEKFKLKPLPEKPQAVVEFGRLSFKDKASIRGALDWPEIARYYDAFYNIHQENAINAAWAMQSGQIPRGRIPYMDCWIYPKSEHIPPSQQWEKDPGGFISHKPECKFRDGGWLNKDLCDCYRGVKNGRMKELKPETDNKSIASGEYEEEVPF